MSIPIKTIFFGTPDFAVPSLQLLTTNLNLSLVTVVTQPDQKVGRKQISQAPPIKKLAEKHNLAVLQPDKINQKFIKQIQDLKVDLMVVVAYGLIIPQELLDLPKYGSLNLHASLLPKHRGASPIQSAILHGEATTGNTIMLLDAKMDHGPILAQEEIKIDNNETGQTLSDRLAQTGAVLLNNTIIAWLNNQIKPQPQDDSRASYCQLLERKDGRISWHKSAQEIKRQIRAYYPWPGTFTDLGHKRLKIISADILDVNEPVVSKQTGLTFLTPNRQLGVTCGHGSLIIELLQLEGSRVMTSQDFILGHHEIINTKLL